MVRIPERYRLDKAGNKIGEGKICKIAVASGVSKLLAVRGSIGVDRPEIRMAEKTRNDLGVTLGEEYDFEIRQSRWPGHICWSWTASDPAYRIPAQIAVSSLILGFISLILGLIGFGIASVNGFNKRSAAVPIANLRDPRAWFMESWDKGVITVQHEGRTDEATCDHSMFFGPEEGDTHDSRTCSLALDVIGRNVQPVEGKQRDSDGWIISMWSVGDTLALKRYKDEHSPLRQEHYIITSVMRPR
jgi:hypothetical protein